LAVKLARAKRRRVVVACADYDLANEPWFNYGSMRGGIRKRVATEILTLADSVLVPSAFSRDMALRNTVLKNLPEKLRVVPHGFDAPAASHGPPAPKESMVLTVGTLNPETWIRKGHREFVQIARLLPERKFYLVGRCFSPKFFAWIKAQTPANLELAANLSESELFHLMRRAKVYVQLSYMEGFGCSLAEAMLAECVPVVSRNGALPEVVGESGYYADYGDLRGAAAAIEAALQDSRLGSCARQRILREFPLERRRQALKALLSSLFAGSDVGQPDAVLADRVR